MNSGIIRVVWEGTSEMKTTNFTCEIVSDGCCEFSKIEVQGIQASHYGLYLSYVSANLRIYSPTSPANTPLTTLYALRTIPDTNPASLYEA